MGCSASMEVDSSPSLPSTKIICPPMDEVAEKKATPRNWSNIMQNHSRKLDRLILANRELYIDCEFPPEHKSIFKRKESRKTIVWRRPGELSMNPSLISDGTSRHDMKQGDLNDCWFLSTLSAIAEKPQLISKIIPDDNTFGTSAYDGKFHCRFWQFGEWVDVFIDDLLPTVNGEILFAHSSDPNEFWVSLVEKAYAKLNHSYEALEFGFEADAFTDLTGGLAEWYSPHDLKDSEFYLIRAAFQCGAVIGCLSVDKEERGIMDRNGMISNHSYVITGVEEIPHQNFTAKLIRVRNPWGDTEWEGAWCDGSDEWAHVPEDVKLELELTSQDDGEFWMCFQDFQREYCNMIICNLSPDFDNDGISDKAEWQLSRRGKWENGTNAGGWLECETFNLNPQYLLILYPDVNVQRRYSGRLPVAIALMQEFKRAEALTGGELYAIGFEIFHLRDHPLYPLGKQFFQSQDPLMPENEETYAEYRETSGRFFLGPGEYLLVPSTHQAAKSRNYLLRTFSVGKMDCRPLGNCLPPDGVYR